MVRTRAGDRGPGPKRRQGYSGPGAGVTGASPGHPPAHSHCVSRSDGPPGPQIPGKRGEGGRGMAPAHLGRVSYPAWRRLPRARPAARQTRACRQAGDDAPASPRTAVEADPLLFAEQDAGALVAGEDGDHARSASELSKVSSAPHPGADGVERRLGQDDRIAHLAEGPEPKIEAPRSSRMVVPDWISVRRLRPFQAAAATS